MSRHNIPTLFCVNLTEIEPVIAYIKQHGAPLMVKASDKGVLLAQTVAETIKSVEDML